MVVENRTLVPYRTKISPNHDLVPIATKVRFFEPINDTVYWTYDCPDIDPQIDI